MSGLPNPDQPWRGKTRKWFFSQKAATISRLKSIIQQYDRAGRPSMPAKSLKASFFTEAVTILDAFQPPLQDDWVQQLFRVTPLMPPPAGPVVVQAPVPAPPPPQPVQPVQVAHPWLPPPGPQTTQPELLLRPAANHLIRIPVDGLVADTTDDLGQILAGPPNLSAVNRIAAVKRSSPAEIFDFRSSFPYRGRGPIWGDNSCALDCCIVAARILNLGITIADKGAYLIHHTWMASLDANVRGFVDLTTRADWETMSAQQNVDIRQNFLRNVVYPALQQSWVPNGRFLSAAALWEIFTVGVGQFQFRTSTRVECQTCNAQYFQNATPTGTATGVQLLWQVRLQPNDPKPSMEHLLNRQFSTRPQDPMDHLIRLRPCRNCNATASTSKRIVLHGRLPPRLVVAPHTSYADVVGATSSAIRVRYTTHDGEGRMATYRWIGGIYNAGKHFRLYWTDCSITDRNCTVKMYDGKQLSGAIVGGIPPAGGSIQHDGSTIGGPAGEGIRRIGAINPDDRVPKYWSDSATLLYYERISDVASEEQIPPYGPASVAIPTNISAKPSTPQGRPQGRLGNSGHQGNTCTETTGANANRGDLNSIDLTSDEPEELPSQLTTIAGKPSQQINNEEKSELKRKASVTDLTNSPPQKKTKTETAEVKTLTEIQTTTKRSTGQISHAKTQKQMLEQQALLANTLPKIKKEPFDLTGETLQPPTTRTNPQATTINSPFETARKGAQRQQLPLKYTHESESKHQHYKSHFEASMQAQHPSVSSNQTPLNLEPLNPNFPLETPSGDTTNKSLPPKPSPHNPQWLYRAEDQPADVSTSSSHSASLHSSASTSGFLPEEITLEDMFGETGTRSVPDLSVPPDDAFGGFSGGSGDEIARVGFEGEVGREESLLGAVKEKVVEGVEAVKGFFEG